MKLAVAVLSTFALLAPATAQAEVRLNLQARVAPQCEVLTIDSVAGSADIVVRTACNLEQYELAIVEPNGSVVEAVLADNAAASHNGDGSIFVRVESPGVQTLRITVADPVAAQAPVIALQAA
jgi:hypothetical protein